jgi:hypothetical protein
VNSLRTAERFDPAQLKETIVDLRKHVSPIPGQQLDGATGNVRRPQRVLSMAAVIFTALLLGAAVGRALPTKPEADAVAQRTSPAPAPISTFVYYPSQYQPDFKPAAQVEDIQAF